MIAELLFAVASRERRSKRQKHSLAYAVSLLKLYTWTWRLLLVVTDYTLVETFHKRPWREVKRGEPDAINVSTAVIFWLQLFLHFNLLFIVPTSNNDVCKKKTNL